LPDSESITGYAKALVLEEFNKPFVLREFPLPEPGDGEVLAKVTSAGICGSDLHAYKGHDPRTPLPMIGGHEGVGEVASIGDGAKLHGGGDLEAGMPIIWERSLTCGKCYFCLRNERYLCVDRQIYGINITSEHPPHLFGNYATHILLKKGSSIFKRDTSIDPSVLVPATCSGTTAAHTHNRAEMKEGDTVVIYGSGPIAAFQVAFALDAGAKWVLIITRAPGIKSEIAAAFGADEVLFRSDMDTCKIVNYLQYQTGNVGADVVIDTTPDPTVFGEAMQILRRGGTYVNPGLAIPADPVPLDLFTDVVNKNATIRGVWASDASHLDQAVKLVQSGRYPFDKLVTHRFKLEEHEDAWRVLNEKQGVKLVFEP
jgi:threonine dehydrogenase-like Zn-dependent dehydrogenase